MTDRSSTPGCEEAAVRLARFILMSHQSGDRYESDAMLTIAKALIARSESGLSVAPAAWLEIDREGDVIGVSLAKDPFSPFTWVPVYRVAQSAGVQSATELLCRREWVELKTCACRDDQCMRVPADSCIEASHNRTPK